MIIDKSRGGAMKIIVAPSKTQQYENKTIKTTSSPVFMEESQRIRAEIRNFGREDFANVMKIKGKKLDEVVELYSKEDNELKEVPAIECYTGFVFRELEMPKYDSEQLQYMNGSVRILSAMYGVLRPSDLIRGYRLDMTMKFGVQNLYKRWNEKVDEYFRNEEIIINLASKEFSKMISKKMIDIDFKVIKEGKLKTIGTYAKKARGMMLDYIIKNRIQEPTKLKEFSLDGYEFSDEKSKDNSYVFIKEMKQ